MRAAVSNKNRPAGKGADKPFREEFNPLSFTIPPGAHTLEGFRRWSRSDDFPQHGNIFFLAGEIYIDMSPERLNSHSRIKSGLCLKVGSIVQEEDLGDIFIDSTRLVHPGADLSVEPDALFISWASYESGLIKRIPTADENDFIELEGSADWVAEILSPSSEKKDTEKLFRLYHLARVQEYWLIDARGPKIQFSPFQWQPEGFQPIQARGGWYPSKVIGKSFRWQRKKNRLNEWTYFLEAR